MAPKKIKYDIKQLAEKYANGTISKDEKTYFEQWYASFNDSEAILKESRYSNADALRDAIFNKVLKEIEPSKASKVKIRRLQLFYRVAAAVLLLFVSVGVRYLIERPVKPQMAQNQKADISPGGNKATLTLANGKKILLTDVKNGKLAQESSAEITKVADGKIVYATATSAHQHSALVYNTVTTPMGGQYSLTLSDGTKVMLDASSSIRYPVVFNDHERRVEITGQVYFEVVHNAHKPFRVIAGKQMIEDLGTQFNINAYADEPVARTTLVKGSIRISKGNQSLVLKPGEQASVSSGNQIRIVDDPDIDEAIAWKNGYFKFDDEDLGGVMREISRWYNVQVTYDAALKNNITFLGEVSRSKNISAVLRIMEATGKVHFQVAGRRVTVMP
ncbi:MAG: FecR family protein [Mucilaginibacter sp.]